MKSYVIHLIRNMPCQGNLEGRYIGRTESPLAASSIQDLLELKRRYRYPSAGAFYASPSTRSAGAAARGSPSNASIRPLSSSWTDRKVSIKSHTRFAVG